MACVLVLVSATPAPSWAYGGAAVLALTWLVALLIAPQAVATQWWTSLRVFVPVAMLALAGMELPYHLSRRLPVTGRTNVFVIGDSLSAGTGDQVVPWPARLAQDRDLRVVNLAVAGASTASGRRQAEQLPDEDGTVIVFLGGNDIIAHRPVRDFEQDLDYILSRATARRRSVVMVETPLPPFANGYGEVQRRLAARHHVTLLPKRELAMILARPSATTDGLHLSAAGQAAFADVIRYVLGAANTK
jgi:lysophospholipase L1-like esterase